MISLVHHLLAKKTEKLAVFFPQSDRFVCLFRGHICPQKENITHNLIGKKSQKFWVKATNPLLRGTSDSEPTRVLPLLHSNLYGFVHLWMIGRRIYVYIYIYIFLLCVKEIHLFINKNLPTNGRKCTYLEDPGVYILISDNHILEKRDIVST